MPPSISSLTSSQTERRGGDIARAAATERRHATINPRARRPWSARQAVARQGPAHCVSLQDNCARLSQPCLTGSRPAVSATLTTIAFDNSSLRWLEISTRLPTSKGPPCMRRLLSRLIFDRLISLCPTWLSLTAAQWRSRVAEGHREATCLDGHEHGGRPMLVRRRVVRTDDDNSEGSSLSGAKIAPHPCIRSIREDRNHDAVIRISGEAPGQRTHSSSRLGSHGGNIGSPPPRIVIGCP